MTHGFLSKIKRDSILLWIETVRGGPRSYKLRMNGSEIEAEIHFLRDGGLLMQVNFPPCVLFSIKAKGL